MPKARQNRPNTLPAPQQVPATVQPPSFPVALRYLQNSPIRVRGPVTGRLYDFSSDRPVQAVESRDAATLLRTRFFRQN